LAKIFRQKFVMRESMGVLLLVATAN
jgi:hypothetical protein